MIITKTNPVGIDKKIDTFQRVMYSSLIKTWNTSKYNCYPRCYRNQTADGYAAEMFTGGVDYQEVYIDDTVSASSFFGIGQEQQVVDGQKVANVHLIFSVNLKEIKPGPQRNDEEVKIDVERLIQSIGLSHGWQITKETTGIDKILNEYPGSKKTIGLKYKDMHPFFWFRYDMNVYYDPTIINC